MSAMSFHPRRERSGMNHCLTATTVPLLLVLALFLLPAPLHAWRSGELLIWINSDKGYNGLREVAARFHDELGIRVTIETPEGLTDKFQQAAQAGKGPDIVFWAHDRLGEWADAGLLRPVEMLPGYRGMFFPKGWEAVEHNGVTWGYPVAFEVVGLIYNRALITEPPTQLEQMEAVHRELRARDNRRLAILWDYNNAYFTWGVLASGDAYIFGRTPDGRYDVSDIGVARPDAVDALDAIVGLIESGIMPRGASYSVMEQQMNRGNLAMMISGPWAWSNLRRSGIDFGVAPVPGVNGNPGRPFVGTLAAFFNRSSPNTDIAREFLEHYVLTPEGLRRIDRDVPVGVPAHIGFYEELAAVNELVAASMVNVENGQLMPSIPQMGRFWSAVQSSLQIATNGRATPAAALEEARRNMEP
jgi:maltose/maltodextrin transport system substrate-binding protein